jgi:uncharacterized protein (TIGR02118 family)
MVKLTVLYGHPDDPDAFEEYYANTHMPLVDEIPNLQRYEAARIIATPDGSEPPYYRIFEGYFEDMEQLQSSLSTPEGQAAPNDIPNFATGGRRSSSLRWTRRRPFVTPNSANSVKKLSEKGSERRSKGGFGRYKEGEMGRKGLPGGPWGYATDAPEAFRTVSRRSSRNLPSTRLGE